MRVLWICNICIPRIAKHLQLNASPKEGWLSGLSDQLLSHREETGVELGICFPASPELAAYKSTEAAEGLTVYGFYEDLLQAQNYDGSMECRFREIFDDFMPDIIHIFGTEYPHALAAERAFGRPERTLVGIQGICALCGAKYLDGIPTSVKEGASFRDWLKKDSLRMQQLKFLQRGVTEQQVLRGTGHIAGRTAFDKSYAAAVHPEAAYHVLRETLRPVFYEGEWTPENAVPHSLFVSQADYALKGFHDLLQAAGQLRKQYPDLTIRVAGTSLVNYSTVKQKLKITGYGKYLRRLIKQFGMEECVTFLGPLTAEEMKREYLRASVFVCCSLLENSPNSLGEAMLLKVPCVAPAVGGIPDMLQNAAEGLLYEGYDSSGTETALYFEAAREIMNLLGKNTSRKQLLQALRRELPGKESKDVSRRLEQCLQEIWENPERAVAMGQAASLHAAKTHDPEENLRRLIAVYKEIGEQN